MAVHNPMCGGTHCTSPTAEVRVLPTGKSSNAILCRSCYNHELAWRRNENKRLSKDFIYPLPAWDTLTVYNGAE